MERKIAHRLVRLGMGVAVLLGVIMAALQIAVDYRGEYRDNIALLERILLVASSGAEQAARQGSERLAAEVIEPLLAYDFVAIAEIIDHRGATLGHVSRSPEWTAGDRLMDVFTDAYASFGRHLFDEEGSVPIGELNVIIHPGTMLRDFYSRAQSVVITGILKNILLVAVLLAIFNSKLTRPLTLIIEKMRAVDPRQPEPFFVPDDIKRAGNELTSLSETTNGILSANKAYLTEISELSRERDATNEKLQHAERLSAIGQLVGGVSHDFNNILSVIVGASELMSDPAPGLDEREMLDTIRRAADKGSNLTSQLLAYSRKQPLAPKSLSVADVCSDVRQMLRDAVGTGYAIELLPIAPGLRCLADRQQLDRVLMNLALNARDAMPGGGTIRIGAEAARLDARVLGQEVEKEPGLYVCFKVFDHGIGMTEETLVRAFEPYFTTKGVGKGSGLGLAMAYGFAKQSNGHIMIDSRPDHGTTVQLYLPHALDCDLATPARRTSGPVVTTKFDSRKILVVEDDPAVLTVIRKQVAALGFDFVCVESPDEALEAFRTDPTLDGALLDVILRSSLTGPQLAQIFLSERPNFKIVFMSGYSVNEFDDYDLEASGHVLLTKPFSRAELGTAFELAFFGQHDLRYVSQSALVN